MYSNLETLVYLFSALLYGKICAKPETASLLNPERQSCGKSNAIKVILFGEGSIHIY